MDYWTSNGKSGRQRDTHLSCTIKPAQQLQMDLQRFCSGWYLHVCDTSVYHGEEPDVHLRGPQQRHWQKQHSAQDDQRYLWGGFCCCFAWWWWWWWWWGRGGVKCFPFKYSSLERVVFSDPITDVQIESPMKAAIQGQLYNLTCKATGPVDHVYWVKNGEPLQADNQNKTIMFNPLQKNHTGLYHCYARNVVSTVASHPYLLLVNCK